MMGFARGLQSFFDETPFCLKKGQMPDLIKLSVVVKGNGKVWVQDVELLKAPLPAKP